MMPSDFDNLFDMMEAKLQPKANSRPLDSISPKEKLCVTLEFLASGTLQRHLASIYRISKQHVGPIIEETCKVISEVLKHLYLEHLNEETWVRIGNDFNKKWNFPNVAGTIDGKHIGIKSPNNSTSCFYNYKGFHSIVLMAVADSNYRFIYADIGSYGSEGDSTVFQRCDFGNMLHQRKLNLPGEQLINGKYIPYVFLADDAFPLHRNIMKPFKPQLKGQPITDSERIFNYRLSRARRCVENAFGILSARWICLARTLFLNPDRAQKVVSACCSLHNYLLKASRDEYCPLGFDDTYDDSGFLVEGNWRKIVPVDSIMNHGIANQTTGRPTKNAI